MGNDGLSSKQVGSQASRRLTWRLAWIQPVCISINAVPALKGLKVTAQKRLNFASMVQKDPVPVMFLSMPRYFCKPQRRQNGLLLRVKA